MSIRAEAIAVALRGSRVGCGWIARCPAHDDRQASLSIREADEGKILVHCFAGCDQTSVIAALRLHGLWQDSGRPRFIRSAPRLVDKGSSEGNDNTRTKAALSVWQSTSPAGGTLVETYLSSRGLLLSPPATLRFHAGLRHPSGGNWPAMVALVTRGTDDVPVAVLRTFVARDGSGKAPVEPTRMMLGPCRGGAVRLGSPAELLMVGEGIETCLASMQATGTPTWAALSTSGLRALELPVGVRNVIVLADGDDPGEAAAQDSARRWKREGRGVRIARPPQGMDFNDLLMDRVSGIKESVA
jgi:putative DNA primase/helicase